MRAVSISSDPVLSGKVGLNLVQVRKLQSRARQWVQEDVAQQAPIETSNPLMSVQATVVHPFGLLSLALLCVTMLWYTFRKTKSGVAELFRQPWRRMLHVVQQIESAAARTG